MWNFQYGSKIWEQSEFQKVLHTSHGAYGKTWEVLQENQQEEQAIIMKKMIATETPLEVLDQVVPGKIMLVVRNLKLIMNWKITLPLTQ